MVMTSGGQLIIGNDMGNIEFWNVVNGERRARVKAHTSRINAIAAFPDGHSVVTAGRDRDVTIWDVQSTERITNLAGHPRQVLELLSPAMAKPWPRVAWRAIFEFGGLSSFSLGMSARLCPCVGRALLPVFEKSSFLPSVQNS
jgi:hypothetical protein